MLQQSGEIADGSQIDADLVIIGAGAAGITMAHSLRDSGLRIVVLESGGETYDDAMQDLYRGRIIGVPNEPLHDSRLRFFGGTTNHWAGWCRPLEAVDFEGPEPWPFGRSDMQSHYEQAAMLCELGPARFDAMDFWQAQAGGEELTPLATQPDKLETAIFQISPPTHFGERYGGDLQAAANVTVILDATALSLTPADGHDPNQDRKRIAGVEVRSLDGRRFSVRGRAVVVATGGLETPRLLLHSTNVHPAGAGNERDLVGRYFQDHAWLPQAAYLSFAQPGTDLPLYFEEHQLAGATMFGTLASSAQTKVRDDVGGFRIVLQPSSQSQLGFDSAQQLVDGISDGRVPNNFWDHVGSIFGDLDLLADKGYRGAFGTPDSPFRSAPSSVDPIDGAWVDINFEQTPNRDSRVRLDGAADAVDAFGQRRIVMDWQLNDRDRRTANRALDLLAEEVGRLGLGRLRVLEGMTDLATRWPDRLTGSRHHMGTARMADDPAAGVTDANGRVHSTENLYICGSALFPSSGYANPTLTIVALALRQAEHLAQQLSQRDG